MFYSSLLRLCYIENNELNRLVALVIMNKDEGLLSSLIEKIKTELQGLVRYEVLRGLDKPEANNWIWNSVHFETIGEFLNSTMSNSIYSAEKIPVRSYLSMPSSLGTKFKLIKDPGNFYLPREGFLNQTFLNEILNGTKFLLLNSVLFTDLEVISQLKPLSCIYFNHKSLALYFPNSFTESKHDSDFITTVCLTLEQDYAIKVYEQYCIYSNIQSFKFPKPINNSFRLHKPILPEVFSLSDNISAAIDAIQELSYKDQTIREIQSIETHNHIKAKELLNKDYNEELFDQIIEINDA
jgi:hypothetical protein